MRPNRPETSARPLPFALLSLLGALALAGCEGDDLAAGRADSGVATPDSGTDETLPYQVGMRFKYRGQLNYRTATQDERDAIYELTLTLTAVDDKGAQGMSAVTATAGGARIFEQNWDLTAGAHSWAALAGPADATDRVSGAATVLRLDQAPPQPPVPKRQPPPARVFLDRRRFEQLRRDFTDQYTAIGPRFISPTEDPAGRWVLALDGRDPSMEFYPEAARRRRTSVAYDPRGWLVEISETLGDTTLPNTPSGRFTLTLIEGPR